MNRIEFGAFELTKEIKDSVNSCLESGWLTMGPRVKELEAKWCKTLNYPFARLLSSGTAADTACCMALYEIADAHPGDEVICPALSFIASANSIRAAGLQPRFVDVRKETLGIDETLIRQAINSRTKAIMSVNLMGRPVELDLIQDICEDYGLIHIIDNCEAYGSEFKGKQSLEYGDFETSSHFLAHIIFGVEGGIVSSRDAHNNSIIDAIRSHGRMNGSNYFNHEVWGLNFKPSDLHASIGLPEIGDFWTIFKKRKENLNTIKDGVIGAFSPETAYFVEEDYHRVNAPHAFSITLKNASKLPLLTDALDRANIAWKRNFGSMPTQHKAFKYLGYRLGDFPNAEHIGDAGIHIGVHKLLTGNDLDRIITTIRSVIRLCR